MKWWKTPEDGFYSSPTTLGTTSSSTTARANSWRVGDLPIPELFQEFIEKRIHIALVVDDYGAVGALVTMEDIIETLLDLEIMDESDHVEDLQLLARKNWEQRAKRLGLDVEASPEQAGE